MKQKKMVKLPDIKPLRGLKHGLCWHVHHEEVLEYCWDTAERLFYLHSKPLHEQQLRFKLFKPVTTKGATGAVRKFILESRKKCYGDKCALNTLAEKCGFREATDFGLYDYYPYLRTAMKAVMKLHRRQCDPRCPCRTDNIRNNILKFKNRLGNYCLMPKGR